MIVSGPEKVAIGVFSITEVTDSLYPEVCAADQRSARCLPVPEVIRRRALACGREAVRRTPMTGQRGHIRLAAAMLGAAKAGPAGAGIDEYAAAIRELADAQVAHAAARGDRGRGAPASGESDTARAAR